MKKKRIAFAWNYVEWGGAQMYCIGLVRRIRNEFDVTFVLPRQSSNDLLEMCRREGIRIETLRYCVSAQPASTISQKLLRHFRKFLSEAELVRHLRRRGFDLVHVELGPWQSLLALALLAHAGPVFITIHNRLPTVGWLRRLLWSAKFRIADRLQNLHAFAANQDAKRANTIFSGSHFSSNITVTSANINPEELASVNVTGSDREEIRQRLGVGPGEKLLLTVGQFIDRKGRDVLLDSVGVVAETHPHTRFVWITNSILEEDDLGRVSRKSGPNFNVVRMKDVAPDRCALLKTIKCADIFVLPSLVEGLPIALMEAMGLGLPVISTSINGIPEAVTSGVNGILVPPADARALAEAIKQLLEDPAYAIRLGAEAERILDSALTEPVVGEIAAAAYREAVAKW